MYNFQMSWLDQGSKPNKRILLKLTPLLFFFWIHHCINEHKQAYTYEHSNTNNER